MTEEERESILLKVKMEQDRVQSIAWIVAIAIIVLVCAISILSPREDAQYECNYNQFEMDPVCDGS